MDKLRLGTIGTSWITDSFIEAALESEKYTLQCVYSRGAEKAKEFAGKYGDITIETDLETFMNKDTLDIIYIASPNSLHYEQALLGLKAGKHVVVEKPASTNVDQWEKMLEVAKENDVFVFEAARHMHIPNLKVIQDTLNDFGDIQGATFAYAKYSSRYDAVLAGNEPNIFSLDFAGGVLMDLGIYPVYTAVALFGKPQSAKYFPRKMKTGVDGSGTILLQYKAFDVTVLISKTTTSMIGMEIYGETDTLVVDHATDMTEATRVDAKSLEEEKVALKNQNNNTMYYEAEKFAEMIANKDTKETLEHYEELSELARIVSDILHDLRMQNNLKFTFEK